MTANKHKLFQVSYRLSDIETTLSAEVVHVGLCEQDLESEGCLPIKATLEEQSKGESFFKQSLEPLFHYAQYANSDSCSDKESWEKFVEINERFALSLIGSLKSDDLVFIQDPKLLLLPELLKAKGANCVIGLSFNTPFPSSEIFRCLPERSKVLAGVLKSDIVFFETFSYSRHFVSSCARILGVDINSSGVEYQDSQTNIVILPRGINHVTDIKSYVKTIQPSNIFSSPRIVCVDKTSQVKSCLFELYAFESYLKMYSSEKKPVFIQIVIPDGDLDQKIYSKVTDLVSKINGEFGSIDYTPVQHLQRSIPKEEYFSLMASADLGIILCEREASCIVPFEFIISQEYKKSPLIISEFAGIATSLGAAMILNPFDRKAVAKAINEALNFNEKEKSSRYFKMQQLVNLASNQNQIEIYKKSLEEIKIERINSETFSLPFHTVISSYFTSEKRLILMDYDGTLTPIKKLPTDAFPSKKLLEILTKLTADKKNLVYVISGRDQSTLDSWLKVKDLGLCAEHGSFIKHPKDIEWIQTVPEEILEWKKIVLPIFEYYVERTPGSFIEHKKASMTWHYRLSDPQFGTWQAKELQVHLGNAICSKLPLEILLGKKNVEVRPSSSNKGTAVKRIISENGSFDFVFCAGDDKTDEDMFKVFKDEESFTCFIGMDDKQTAAKYKCPSPEYVIQLLGKLVVEKQ